MTNYFLGCAIDGCDEGPDILNIILISAAILIAVLWIIFYIILRKRSKK